MTGLQIDPAVATSASGNTLPSGPARPTLGTPSRDNSIRHPELRSATEFQINTTTSHFVGPPLPSAWTLKGNFVVVWSGAGPNSNNEFDYSDIFAQQFNAVGQEVGSQFEVDQWEPGLQSPGMQDQPSVAVAPDGTFVITWTSTPGNNITNQQAYNSAIFAREYGAGDAALGNEFQITPVPALPVPCRTWRWTPTTISWSPGKAIRRAAAIGVSTALTSRPTA